MKRILSLILVVSMFLSLTSFAAITNIKVYEDNTTGYTYIFGKFADGDTNVGFEINGKEYDLMKKDVNDPSKTAFQVAKEKGNVFGIGFLDNTGKSEPLTAIPFTYDANGTIAKQADDAIEFAMPECDNLYLKDLKINGTTITAFSPYKSYYYYETDDVSSITKEDITAVAEATYANVTVADAGNNNYVITTTAPDTEEAKTVEIRVREKGKPQNPEEQIASFNGTKTVRIYKNLSEEFSPVDGNNGIYDRNDVRIKASSGNEIPSNSSEYSVILIQFDISKITNINDRVLLNIPVKNANTASNPAKIAEIGFMAVDTELPISYHPGNSPYFSGTKNTNEYTKFYGEIKNGAVTSTTNSDLTSEMINKEIANAFEMLDYKNIENDVAGRVEVANSVIDTKTVDVTDYIKAKLENDDDTVTFMVRAIFNPEINSTDEEVCIIPYSADAYLSFTKFEGEIAASDIKVNGTTLEDFNEDTLNYSVIVDKNAGIPQVAATVADTENLTVEVIQATEVPGSATVKVTSYDGQSKTYTINFDNPFEQGIFTIERKWSVKPNLNATAKLTESSLSKIICHTVNNPYYRHLYEVTFDGKGLNENDTVIMTIPFTPYNNDPKNGFSGGYLTLKGATVSFTENSATSDRPYVTFDGNDFAWAEISGTSKTDLTFDITEFVKEQILAGNKTIYISAYITLDKGDTKWTYQDLKRSDGSVVYYTTSNYVQYVSSSDATGKKTKGIYVPNSLENNTVPDDALEIGDSLADYQKIDYLGGEVTSSDITIVHNVNK